MSKKTKLCPFRRVSERENDGITGKTVEREWFQPCIRHRCMAYVFTSPIFRMSEVNDPVNWGCARLLKGDTDNGI